MSTKKTTKKPSSPAKKTTPSTSARVSSSVRTEKTTPTKKSLRFKKRHIVILLGVLLLAGLLYYFRGYFVVATVNGQPISRVSLVRELEEQNGKQALTSLITKTLIEQEARKKNVTVSDSEVDTQIKEIETNLEKQGQKLNAALEAQGMSINTLRNQIRLQKLVEKLVGNVAISDKEVNEYLEQNKESLPTDQKPEQLKPQIKEQLRQTKLNEKIQTWLSDIQTKAKITHFTNL